MAKNVDTISGKFKKNNSVIGTKPTEDIWIKHYHVKDLIKKDTKPGWSLPKKKKTKKVSGVFVRPASKELLAEAKKVKKQQKKSLPKTPWQKIGHGSLVFGKAFLLIMTFSSIAFAAAVFAYRENYKSRAYYGVKILGEEVGGKNEKEIKEILDKKIESLSFSFAIDGEEIIAKPNEAGVSFSSEKTAQNAISQGKNGEWYRVWIYPAGSLVQKTISSAQAFSLNDFKSNLDFHYDIDEKKLADFTQSLSLKFNEDSKNAGLVMQGTEVQVIPAVFGRKVVAESVKAQIAEAVRMVKSEKIKIEVDKVNPAILEADTRRSIEEAKSLISLPVNYTYQEKTFTPDKATVGGWIVFNTVSDNGREYLKPTIDAKKVYPYVYGLASQINIPPVNRKITVKNGVETVVDQEGKEGLAVDVDKASVQTANTLTSVKAVKLELPTYVVKPKTNVNNVLVADWSKYIEVNISTQTMCAYLAGGEKVNCWSVTTGQNGLSTPIGTFLISRKSGEGGAPGAYGGGVCMPNPPSATPLCGINYVSTFTPQGHAIHEAWWRSSFGGQDYKWNGSHGCVNATYGIAQWIYYWAPIGTPVIIHY